MLLQMVEPSSSFSPNADVPAASGRSDHFLGLDTLRGVAALGVVWFHCSSRMNLPLLFAHGYLAVDFFFVLSGFVIAKAYGQRLATGRMTMGRFALVRAVRLMPMVVVATLLAAVIEIGRPGIVDQGTHTFDLLLATTTGALLIPTLWRTSLEFAVFPLNGPFWSLSLEAIANAIFAIFARSRSLGFVLAVTLAFCAPLLVYATWIYGETGFGSVATTYSLGFARVGWSFAAGVVLYRFRAAAPCMPLMIPSFVLVTILLVPASSGLAGRAFDVCAVLLGLPAIVWVASAARIGAEGQRWAAWSGDLSYPIYALHYPIIRVFGLLTLRHGLSMSGRLIAVALSTTVIVAAAGLTYAFIDVPIRQWLTTKTLRAYRSAREVPARA